MLSIIRHFFQFCGEENRRKFTLSLFLGVGDAFFNALKIISPPNTGSEKNRKERMLTNKLALFSYDHSPWC